METKDILVRLILIENKVKSFILRRLEDNNKKTGLSLEEKMLIFMFSKNRSVKPKELIREFHFKKSNLASSCTKLCASNLIHKIKDVRDAREALFSLTKKGEEKVLEITSSIKLDLKKEEKEALSGVINRLEDFVER